MRENFAAKNKTKRCDEIAKLERCERKTLVCNSLSETGTFDLKKKTKLKVPARCAMCFLQNLIVLPSRHRNVNYHKK